MSKGAQLGDKIVKKHKEVDLCPFLILSITVRKMVTFEGCDWDGAHGNFWDRAHRNFWVAEDLFFDTSGGDKSISLIIIHLL